MRHVAGIALAALLVVSAPVAVGTWNAQGHRLVGLVAENHLTPVARQNVRWLLDRRTLADVAAWADQYQDGNNQTSFWHYINIPPDAAGYDRDRDCPRQPGVAGGGRGDRWRDCIIDRIAYHEERVASPSLDRADRATALKFLVHFVGDLHQPFHVLGVERGGNGIPVSVFGSPTCTYEGGPPLPCNLHRAWDGALLDHRGLSDREYVTELERRIGARGADTGAGGTPVDWAMESHALAKSALLPPNGAVSEAYYRAHIGVVEQRLALAGLRLAALLNRGLRVAPAEGRPSRGRVR
jgi:hypothetical protein